MVVGSVHYQFIDLRAVQAQGPFLGGNGSRQLGCGEGVGRLGNIDDITGRLICPTQEYGEGC